VPGGREVQQRAKSQWVQDDDEGSVRDFATIPDEQSMAERIVGLGCGLDNYTYDTSECLQLMGLGNRYSLFSPCT
jgi:hypothetical protein